MKFEVYYGIGKTTKAIRMAKINKILNKNKTYVYLPDKVWRPQLVSRDGATYPVSKELLNDKDLNLEPNSTIIIDDAQYLNQKVIAILIEHAINKNVTVYCFCEFLDKYGTFTRIGNYLLNAATDIKKIKNNKIWGFIKYIFRLLFRRNRNV